LENYRRKPSILVFSILGGIFCVICIVVENRVPAAKVVLAMVATHECISIEALKTTTKQMLSTKFPMRQ